MIYTKDEILMMAVEQLAKHLDELAEQKIISQDLTVGEIMKVSDTRCYIHLNNGISYMFEIQGKI
ncbi:MAG: hypothetical protein ACI4TT_00750 [Christensenellales bacterium]